MNDFAWQFSESLAGVVEKAAAGVVSIKGRRRRVPSSGVLWSEGAVVTAHHVMEWDEDIEIGLPDGSTATAAVAGRDPATDLAALRFSGSTTGARRVGGFRRGEDRPSRDVGEPPRLEDPAQPGNRGRRGRSLAYADGRTNRRRSADGPRHPSRLFRQRARGHARQGARREHRQGSIVRRRWWFLRLRCAGSLRRC